MGIHPKGAGHRERRGPAPRVAEGATWRMRVARDGSTEMVCKACGQAVELPDWWRHRCAPPDSPG